MQPPGGSSWLPTIWISPVDGGALEQQVFRGALALCPWPAQGGELGSRQSLDEDVSGTELVSWCLQFEVPKKALS